MNKFSKVITSMSVFALMITGISTNVFAETEDVLKDEITATSNIEAGNRVITINGDSLDLSLNERLSGTVQSQDFALPSFSVKDASGSGNGWTVLLKADSIVHDGSKSTDGISFELTSGTVLERANGDEINNDMELDEKLKLAKEFSSNQTLAPEAGVEIAKAGQDQGMGIYDFKFASEKPLKLTVSPDKIYAGTYTMTLNWEFQNATTE